MKNPNCESTVTLYRYPSVRTIKPLTVESVFLIYALSTVTVSPVANLSLMRQSI
jgi:hypothetical protein